MREEFLLEYFHMTHLSVLTVDRYNINKELEQNKQNTLDHSITNRIENNQECRGFSTSHKISIEKLPLSFVIHKTKDHDLFLPE